MPESQIDKQHLYGEYTRTERWRDALSKRLAHKALDIPDDEMQINVDKSKKGLGARELLAMGVLVAGGVYGGSLLTQPTAPVPAEPAIVQPSLDDTDTDTVNVIGFEE
jgi:hypothetical protein